ncbi:hypothetical protein IV203_007837 [Nitzschia inconspicua]|uniref:Uncharacterized protein n=1 Tax=Nitzschia inconspicua TaxID=303405 RepID=A0A9K3KYK4_9STRA|nr:hypothetical protein IV203_007837 [Nitzschia inconspicua]
MPEGSRSNSKSLLERGGRETPPELAAVSRSPTHISTATKREQTNPSESMPPLVTITAMGASPAADNSPLRRERQGLSLLLLMNQQLNRSSQSWQLGRESQLKC